MTRERVSLTARDVELLLDALAYRRREEMIVPGGISVGGKIAERREHGSDERDRLVSRLGRLAEVFELRRAAERQKAEIDADFDEARANALKAFREDHE